MLSGQTGHIFLDDVVVPRGDRIRREVTEAAIASMADSFTRLGQINPIVIRRDRVLVAGETRLLAAGRCGWDRILFQYSDTLDPRNLLSLELEENIKRTDLSWQDQCDALKRYHDLQRELNEGWSAEKTAEAVGLTPGHVSKQLAVAKAIQAGDEKVLATKDFSTALGIVKRKAERKVADVKARLAIVDDVQVQPKDEAPILNVDFTSWVESYSGPAFNLIHCDFPYGINADKFAQGAADAYGGYEDSPETYWKLVSALIRHRHKLLGESGHIIFWFSMKHYAATLEALREFFWVDPYPLVWHKSDNKGTLPDPQRGPRRVYEVAFLCSLGDRKIISPVSNTFSGPTTRVGEHMSEKSREMLCHFFRMVVDENTRLLDPTCGSGSALRAARALGAASVLGLEINGQFADNAARAWTAEVSK